MNRPNKFPQLILWTYMEHWGEYRYNLCTTTRHIDNYGTKHNWWNFYRYLIRRLKTSCYCCTSLNPDGYVLFQKSHWLLKIYLLFSSVISKRSYLAYTSVLSPFIRMLIKSWDFSIAEDGFVSLWTFSFPNQNSPSTWPNPFL